MNRDVALSALVITLIILFFALLTMGVVYLFNSEDSDRESVCRSIGSKLNLEYYDKGYCGWENNCRYTCKFINQNGDTVIKNVQ